MCDQCTYKRVCRKDPEAKLAPGRKKHIVKAVEAAKKDRDAIPRLGRQKEKKEAPKMKKRVSIEKAYNDEGWHGADISKDSLQPTCSDSSLHSSPSESPLPRTPRNGSPVSMTAATTTSQKIPDPNHEVNHNVLAQVVEPVHTIEALMKQPPTFGLPLDPFVSLFASNPEASGSAFKPMQEAPFSYGDPTMLSGEFFGKSGFWDEL
jgi:hypothetical protein